MYRGCTSPLKCTLWLVSLYMNIWSIFYTEVEVSSFCEEYVVIWLLKFLLKSYVLKNVSRKLNVFWCVWGISYACFWDSFFITYLCWFFVPFTSTYIELQDLLRLDRVFFYFLSELVRDPFCPFYSDLNFYFYFLIFCLFFFRFSFSFFSCCSFPIFLYFPLSTFPAFFLFSFHFKLSCDESFQHHHIVRFFLTVLFDAAAPKFNFHEILWKDRLWRVEYAAV